MDDKLLETLISYKRKQRGHFFGLLSINVFALFMIVLFSIIFTPWLMILLIFEIASIIIILYEIINDSFNFEYKYINDYYLSQHPKKIIAKMENELTNSDQLFRHALSVSFWFIPYLLYYLKDSLS